MPVKYEDLKKDQKCIYQAFAKVVGNKDAPEAMGAFVNSKGIDADDDAAVVALATKYGMTEVEMFLGAAWNAETVNLEKGWEYILTVNGQAGMINAFKALKTDVAKGSAVTAIQKKFANEVGHALYCKIKKANHDIEVWHDEQGIYKKPTREKGKGFPDALLIVAYGRARKD